MADNNVNTVINTDTARRTEKQKVKEITYRLEEGLKELFESEKYKTCLSTMSKFHNYSFNSTLLIAMQKPDATLVSGYRAWQKNFERHVNKGERAIRILAPAPCKIKKENFFREEADKLDPMTRELVFDENGMPQFNDFEIDLEILEHIPDIKNSLQAMEHLEDDEMVELSLRVIIKLNDLTDQEFAEIEIVAAE